VTEPLCSICGTPFAGAGSNHVCGSCSIARPSYDAARAALVYEGHSRHLIHSLKYRYKTHMRRPLALMTADLLAAVVAEWQPDLMVPVPLHVRRLRSRGFNQAVLVAEVLAQSWRIPCDRRAMTRNRWTEPQITLSAEERRRNVKDAFSVAADVQGMSVLLIDDVFTTGSTVDECARVLKEAGAVRVLVATVARAVEQ